MGEAKFTPGPWATEGDQIETADGSALIAEMALWDADDEEAQEQFANARLIAAAPELLEALRVNIKGKVMEYCKNAVHPSGKFCTVCGLNSEKDIHCNGCPVAIAEAAIRKATEVQDA